MRLVIVTLSLLVVSFAASAADAPPGQVAIGADQVLRGAFVQTVQRANTDAPMQSVGHFTLAPAHGLIWMIEKPIPTMSIITPQKSVQDFGGIAIKLPIKNLQHLYAMIGGALTRDWNGLETEYNIRFANNGDHWQATLTPRRDATTHLSYVSITVNGAKFVENITMLKGDGGSDVLNFSEVSLGRAALTPRENFAFNEAAQ